MSDWYPRVALGATVVLAACGGSPRFDLAPYGPVGLVAFTVENARGTLHEYATQRFMEEILAAQPGVRVLELGEANEVLQRVGEPQMGAVAARAIGTEYGVAALLTGHLRVSDVRPRISIGGRTTAEAEVKATLTVRMYDAGSGATVWTRSAEGTGNVAQLVLGGGAPVFGAQDPKEAYGDLVDGLVHAVTSDLR